MVMMMIGNFYRSFCMVQDSLWLMYVGFGITSEDDEVVALATPIRIIMQSL